MTESQIYKIFHDAHEAYLHEPTPERAAVVIEAFQAFAAEFIADPVAAHEEVEELRRKLQVERPRAERLAAGSRRGHRLGHGPHAAHGVERAELHAQQRGDLGPADRAGALGRSTFGDRS